MLRSFAFDLAAPSFPKQNSQNFICRDR